MGVVTPFWSDRDPLILDVGYGGRSEVIRIGTRNVIQVNLRRRLQPTKALVMAVSVTLAAAACGSAALSLSQLADSAAPPPVPGMTLEQDPAQYLDSALSLIHAKDIFTAGASWRELRHHANQQLSLRPSLSTADQAIVGVLAGLGDRHGTVISAGTYRAEVKANRGVTPLAALPTGRTLAGHVGYINLPGIAASPLTGEAQTYATVGRDLIGQLHHDGVTRWVVDLRGDTGGDVDPMLLAVGSLLHRGRLIGFASPSGRTTWTSIAGPVLSYGGQVAMKSSTQTMLSLSTQPVAVLIGDHTASAGEAAAIAFEKQAGVRFFGQPTAGATTQPTQFTMPDTSILIFATSKYADRANSLYGGPIEPTTVTDASESGVTNDPTLQAAEQWLSRNP